MVTGIYLEYFLTADMASKSDARCGIDQSKLLYDNPMSGLASFFDAVRVLHFYESSCPVHRILKLLEPDK